MSHALHDHVVQTWRDQFDDYIAFMRSRLIETVSASYPAASSGEIAQTVHEFTASIDLWMQGEVAMHWKEYGAADLLSIADRCDEMGGVHLEGYADTLRAAAKRKIPARRHTG